MGRYVAGEAPAMDRLVEETIRDVGAEVAALAVPRLQGVVLGGGYGRGEGGVFDLPDGSQRLSNDLDFFAVTAKGASGRHADATQARPTSRTRLRPSPRSGRRSWRSTWISWCARRGGCGTTRSG